MTDKLNPKQPLSVEESVLATMWAMEAMVELPRARDSVRSRRSMIWFRNCGPGMLN